jgi:putative restriction endonuclease
MSRESTLAAFSNLNQEAGTAPHKPLLLLYVLTEWLRRGTAIFRFAEIERPVGDLIRDPVFGAASSATARDPFWFLRTDKVWVVDSAAGAWQGSGRPTIEELREKDARGRFSEDIAADLQGRPGLAVELIGQILCLYFDSAQHRHLLERLGCWSR